MDLKVLVENIGLRMIENCCVQIKMIYFVIGEKIHLVLKGQFVLVMSLKAGVRLIPG